MKGSKEVSVLTKNIISSDRTSWIELYYNISKDEVSTKAGSGFFKVTDLINYNSERDIIETVNYFMSL